MPLTIINDAPMAYLSGDDGDEDARAFSTHLNAKAGVYVGGWNIAPDAYLIRAQHFGEAWELLVGEMAEQGSLPICTPEDCEGYETDDIPCEGCDFIDMHGPACTLDVVLRVVRPARGD